MKNIESLIFYSNGHVTACDENGEHVFEVEEKGWMQLYFEYLESKGYDPTQIHIEGQLNGGIWKKISPFKAESGWNVLFEPREKFS